MDRRNVLIPVDDTEDSSKAVQWCLDNFYRDGDELHLFHVRTRVHPSWFAHFSHLPGLGHPHPDAGSNWRNRWRGGAWGVSECVLPTKLLLITRELLLSTPILLRTPNTYATAHNMPHV